MKKLIVTLIIFGAFVTTVNAQAEKYKALFIYNFTKHIEWPASQKTGDFVVGVVGQNILVDKLIEVTNNKKVGNQNIVIQTYKSVNEITNCNIVVLGANNSTPKKLALVLQKINSSTLVVSNGNNSATKGATINFTIQNSKLKFELNNADATKRQLKISTYLHNLAVIVG